MNGSKKKRKGFCVSVLQAINTKLLKLSHYPHSAQSCLCPFDWVFLLNLLRRLLQQTLKIQKHPQAQDREITFSRFLLGTFRIQGEGCCLLLGEKSIFIMLSPNPVGGGKIENKKLLCGTSATHAYLNSHDTRHMNMEWWGNLFGDSGGEHTKIKQSKKKFLACKRD